MAIKLKELRVAAKWSQAELAEAVGEVDPSYISLLERGRRQVTVYLAMAIAEALSKKLGREVTVAEVFGTRPSQHRDSPEKAKEAVS